MILPEGWAGRTASIDDVPAILEVMVACDVAALGEPDTTSDFVLQMLTAPNTEAVVATGPTGRVAGFALVLNQTRSQREDIDVYVHPDMGGPARAPLLDWALATVARRAAGWGRPALSVRMGVFTTDTALIAALTAKGFHVANRYARMRVELPAPTGPVVPPGVTIRAFRPDDAAERLVFHGILQDAFADTADFIPSTPQDWWMKIDHLPRIDWDEWWVALVDGVPVGVLQSDSAGVENGEAWVKNLAVLRGYRGRGIARALLGTAFAAYTAKGRKIAGLGVDLTNPTGAYDLYRAVGMSPAFEADMYERVVPAAG